MTGTVAYTLAKNLALSLSTGISDITFRDNQIFFELKDGNTASIVIPLPKDGSTPKIGKNGNWFIDNIDTGIRAKGIDGKDGPQGDSAYQIALNEGFSGTKLEWLISLQGKPGKNGEQGVSIKDANFNDFNHLILTLSDGNIIDVGQITIENNDNFQWKDF